MTPSVSFADLLRSAVTDPGIVSTAYRQFHNYSIGNQLLALGQCIERGIRPGPLSTFPRKELGRWVRKGEKAITLCQPVRITRTPEHETDELQVFTKFIYRPHWFVLSQTDGEELPERAVPTWEKDRALSTLRVDEIPFDHLNGNCLGFARERSIAINPVNPMPYKTRFHELAHRASRAHDTGAAERRRADAEEPGGVRGGSGRAPLLRSPRSSGCRPLPWVHSIVVGCRQPHP